MAIKLFQIKQDYIKLSIVKNISKITYIKVEFSSEDIFYMYNNKRHFGQNEGFGIPVQIGDRNNIVGGRSLRKTCHEYDNKIFMSSIKVSIASG